MLYNINIKWGIYIFCLKYRMKGAGLFEEKRKKGDRKLVILSNFL